MAACHSSLLAGKNKVASLVEDMLNAVQSEMGRYQRIITYWPCCEWGGVGAATGIAEARSSSLGGHITQPPAKRAPHKCCVRLLTNCCLQTAPTWSVLSPAHCARPLWASAASAA